MARKKGRSHAAPATHSRSAHPRRGGGSGRVLIVLGVLAVAIRAWVALGRPGLPGGGTAASRDETITRMLDGEVLVFDLNPSLRKLSKGVTNLRLPDAKAKGVFADEVK